ncbi:hypothetical protein QAD02_006826 [Eretmocerus hayati]|uniref:Uncharacterized protein n=1 Tax=Eretmocerus hayati TaxID=131215 RepID=A0ACC2N4D4_9HYME|nr:hypothetical protein QAD02_006826 [Eretmocerus hayati]
MLIPMMRRTDDLFDSMYERIIFSGSYYKGTKVGEPDEFDLDLILKLPISYDKIKIDTNHHRYGYVKIALDKYLFEEKYRTIISRWVTDQGRLNQNEFRQWMQGIFTKVYNQLPPATPGPDYLISIGRSGPAFPVEITTPDRTVISVDLVPALEFVNVPLGNGYKHLNGDKKNWLAVAKPLDGDQMEERTLWRLCFYEQEKDFLKNNLNGEIKPVIRMLKKFRDTQDWKALCSYFIETIFYHMLEKSYTNKSQSLAHSSRTSVFMQVSSNYLLYLV